MKYLKIKNKKTGQYCDGSGDFGFDSEGKLFSSVQYINRYMMAQVMFNKELVSACKDDIEVVECEIVPTKTVQFNINKLL